MLITSSFELNVIRCQSLRCQADKIVIEPSRADEIPFTPCFKYHSHRVSNTIHTVLQIPFTPRFQIPFTPCFKYHSHRVFKRLSFEVLPTSCHCDALPVESRCHCQTLKRQVRRFIRIPLDWNNLRITVVDAKSVDSCEIFCSSFEHGSASDVQSGGLDEGYPSQNAVGPSELGMNE